VQGWPNLLQQKLRESKMSWQVVNASVSAETTSGGRSRLDSLLKIHQPKIVVLALGANDGLRVLPIKRMKNNLQVMINMARQQKANVLLVGMRLPLNYGEVFGKKFEQAFVDIFQSNKQRSGWKIAFLPFLLEPVARDLRYFQSDGLHPSAAAQPLIMQHLWPKLLPLLK